MKLAAGPPATADHHPQVLASADWVVELGPEAGENGGTVVFEGEPKQLEKKKTATGGALGAIAAAAAVSPRRRNSVTPEA